MNDVTCILKAVQLGDQDAASELLPLIYNELRELAAARLARERPGQTLDATSLVHEAYLRLVHSRSPGHEGNLHWDGRGHFFGAAAEAMRRILVERARQRASTKHGGRLRRVVWEEHMHPDGAEPFELLALDEMLRKLESHDARAAQIVKLRYFVGMSHIEAAEAMQISRRTADRLWVLAKAWLYQQLAGT